MLNRAKVRLDLRATWWEAAKALALPILIVLTLRWLFIEPYIIPSGSMLPNLQVNDHVLVNKFAYGLRLPFTNIYLLEWSQVQRGDIVVFRYPKDPSVYYVKRVLGLPGEKISWSGASFWINDRPVEQQAQEGHLWKELDWILQYRPSAFAAEGQYYLNENEYFMAGDHRDNSADSRMWGGVKKELMLGRVSYIWLACDYMLEASPRICDPLAVKWGRLFKSPDKSLIY